MAKFESCKYGIETSGIKNNDDHLWVPYKCETGIWGIKNTENQVWVRDRNLKE